MYWLAGAKLGVTGNRHSLFADLLLCGGLGILTAVLAVLTRQPYLVNMLSYAIPYFFAVILVGNGSIQNLVTSEWAAAGAVLLYALVFPHFSFYNPHWTTQAVRIGLSLCVMVICCKFQGQWRMNCVGNMLCFYGENSMVIYVLYGFLIDYKRYFEMIDSAAVTAFLSIALALAVAAVCVAIGKILGISSWWRKLLFGKYV